MAGEIQVNFDSGRTVYVLIRNSSGQIWNGTAFEAYATLNYTTYDVATTEQGTASGYYVGNFPTAIVPGVYQLVAKHQQGATPAESDPSIALGEIDWNGTTLFPLSDLATSGQIGRVLPVKLTRGHMVQNFPIYFKSSIDHITPFTSGVVSGQIARDGGSFGALQSGAFTEIGLGWFNLQSFTSGDLDSATAKVLFTAVGISGGSADPVPLGLILQRVSGL